MRHPLPVGRRYQRAAHVADAAKVFKIALLDEALTVGREQVSLESGAEAEWNN